MGKDKRQPIYLLPRLQPSLKELAEATGISKSILLNIATISLLGNMDVTNTSHVMTLLHKKDQLEEQSESSDSPIRLTIYLSTFTKQGLQQVKEKTNISHNMFINIALSQLVENYQQRGRTIFGALTSFDD